MDPEYQYARFETDNHRDETTEAFHASSELSL
jgi:hypothetical protein